MKSNLLMLLSGALVLATFGCAGSSSEQASSPVHQEPQPSVVATPPSPPRAAATTARLSREAILANLLLSPGRARFAVCVEVVEPANITIEAAAAIVRDQMTEFKALLLPWAVEVFADSVVHEGCPSPPPGLGEANLSDYQPACQAEASPYLVHVIVADEAVLNTSFPGYEAEFGAVEVQNLAGKGCTIVSWGCYATAFGVPLGIESKGAGCFQVATGLIGR